MEIINISQVSKSFQVNKAQIHALKNINLKVEKGDFLALIGLNGAGKTTLIRLLSAVMYPDSGTITIFGKDVSKKERYIKKRIGVVVGSENSLYGKLTAMENLDFFSSFYSMTKIEFKDKANELLCLMNLYDRRNDLVETFSKGMKQKLLIVKALLHDPEILILDEPSNGIDIISNFEIKNLLKKLNNEMKKTIILTTHNLGDAEDLCNKLCILQEGEIIEQGIFSDIYMKHFNHRIISISLKKKIPQNSIDILEGNNLINILESHEDQIFKYSFMINGSETMIDYEFFTNNINMNDLLRIEEEKMTLELLLKNLVNC